MNIKKILAVSLVAAFSLQAFSQGQGNVMEPLSGGNVKLNGYFDDDIITCMENWNKKLMPYDDVIDFFRHGRSKFALGEMPGKAIRSNVMLYRYTHDPELKDITKKAVHDLIGTMKSNGSISCTPVDKQPGDKDGDIWERKYVLLGLSRYYLEIEQDPEVLDAMEKEASSVIDQVGPGKADITELGWSVNNIESSSILEPMMRLYFITGKQKYLDFAKYIIDSGGCKGKNIFEQVYDNVPMYEVGDPYPKAYEMTSIWEGLVEYYRATKDEKIFRCLKNFFNNVKDNEITIIGNAGADICYPRWNGEAWSNTAFEQSNPDIKRMMETCVGVTWMKYLTQYLRLTGDPVAVDYIEKYAYNGLLGAMKPGGQGFSYVNLLNGAKVTNSGWGTTIGGQPVTCCNLNGPLGLAYIPYVAVMQGESGPVVNLYNAFDATAKTAKGSDVKMNMETDFPRSNGAVLTLGLKEKEKFTLSLRIPSWSKNTYVAVNGKKVSTKPGSYLNLCRRWSSGDKIQIIFDMNAELIHAREGRNPKGSGYVAVQWGPVVLARDENIDPEYDRPVRIIANPEGRIAVRQVTLERSGTRMEFVVPVEGGSMRMVDYSSVDCWGGTHVQTWLPIGK